MTYRSTRFDAGELTGLQQAWDAVDQFDAHHVPIVSEVMAGTSYRRQLHPNTREQFGDVNYLLQVTLEPEVQADSARMHARLFLEKAVELLSSIKMPGDIKIDEGGLDGWDITTTKEYIFGTGTAETELLRVYPPWLRARWEQAGKTCMFFCGIQPPRPKLLLEDWMFNWDERILRAGQVVFTPTPDGLKTW